MRTERKEKMRKKWKKKGDKDEEEYGKVWVFVEIWLMLQDTALNAR